MTRLRVANGLAGYEDVNDAHRLSVDPMMRRITGKKIDNKNAASAKPEIYECLEEKGFLYAIRLPANEALQAKIRHLLTRPVGRPPGKPVVCVADFKYQAASWDRPRRVIAKVEWHRGELGSGVNMRNVGQGRFR